MEGERGEAAYKHKGHCSVLLNSNAGEPKGRNVSEGLIGSDTIGKLSGPLCVLSSIKGCRNVKAGSERVGKYLMIETFSIHLLLSKNLAEK